MLAKNYDRRKQGDPHSTRLAKTTLVRVNTQNGKGHHHVSWKKKESYFPQFTSIKHRLRECPSYSLPLLKRRFDNAGLSKATRVLALNAWKEGTRKTYQCYIIQWMMYCEFYKFDPYEPSVRHVTDFLRLLLEDGASYSTINIARCALSAVLETGSHHTIGAHPMVSLVVKGCGNLNPPQPKYDTTWDVTKVFSLFHKWGRNSKLSLLQLSQKLTVLLLLCTAQRGQTVWRMSLSGMSLMDFGIKFRMKHQLKHNKPGEPLSSIKVFEYKKDPDLCPVRCLKEYVHRT